MIFSDIPLSPHAISASVRQSILSFSGHCAIFSLSASTSASVTILQLLYPRPWCLTVYCNRSPHTLCPSTAKLCPTFHFPESRLNNDLKTIHMPLTSAAWGGGTRGHHPPPTTWRSAAYLCCTIKTARSRNRTALLPAARILMCPNYSLCRCSCALITIPKNVSSPIVPGNQLRLRISSLPLPWLHSMTSYKSHWMAFPCVPTRNCAFFYYHVTVYPNPIPAWNVSTESHVLPDRFLQ